MQNTQTTKEADTSEQAKVTSSTCPSHTNTDRLLPKVRTSGEQIEIVIYSTFFVNKFSLHIDIPFDFRAWREGEGD